MPTSVRYQVRLGLGDLKAKRGPRNMAGHPSSFLFPKKQGGLRLE